MSEHTEIVRWVVIENCVTMIAAASTIIGVYALGGGGWCILGLLMLFNLNGPVKRAVGQ